MIDIYIQFIEYLISKQGKYTDEEILFRHRILPAHQGGTYQDKDNILYISYKDHVLAHYYRYLAYSQVGDLKAYLLMSSRPEEIMTQLGQRRARQMKDRKELFFNPEWQKKYGFKGAGKRNVDEGTLEKVNLFLTEYKPEVRSEAGKLGGKARIEKQRREKTNLFDPKALMQKRGNLVRWGISINGKRIPYENLSEDFIEYHLHYGTKRKY